MSPKSYLDGFTNPSTLLQLRRTKRRQRNFLAFVLFLLITVVAYVLLLGLGAVKMSPTEVITVLNGGGTRTQINVIWDLRLPVAIVTVVIGAALAMAGAWTQSMSRNPLASPDILGVTGGASVLVVLGTVAYQPSFLDDFSTFWSRAVLSLMGAIAIVFLLALLGGVGTNNKIVLIGFAISLMCHALVSYLLLKAEILRAAEAQTWLAGSTGFVQMDVIVPLLLGLAPFIALGLWCEHDLALLTNDDATAVMLGVNIARQRALLLIAATGICAIVVSVVGPIGFIALLSPHLARLVTGNPTPPSIITGVAGAALLSTCAVIAGFIPASAPVGAVSSVIGGISLVLLVWRQSKGRTWS